MPRDDASFPTARSAALRPRKRPPELLRREAPPLSSYGAKRRPLSAPPFAELSDPSDPGRQQDDPGDDESDGEAPPQSRRAPSRDEAERVADRQPHQPVRPEVR